MRPKILNSGHPHKAPCSQLKRRLGESILWLRWWCIGLPWSCAPQMRYKQRLAMLIRRSAHSLCGQQGTIPQITRPLTSYTGDMRLWWHICGLALSLSHPPDPWASASPYLPRQSYSPSPAPILTKRKCSCVFACERHCMLFPKVECDDLLSQNVFNSHEYLFFT